MADEKETGFKVTDRRKFNPDGTPRVDSAEETPLRAEPGPEVVDQSARVIEFPGESGRKKEKSDERGGSASAAAQPLEDWSAGIPPSPEMPDPTFESLVNMLAVEAIMHLGLIENPAGGHSLDLAAARHVIDLLGMLDQKTKGNLTREESELMDGVLADLRMQFVAVSRAR